jgi:aminomethyltransferase
MYTPSHFGDPVEEYWKLIEDVTLWDVATERQVEITGPDAFAFTDWLITRDLSRCPVGRCRYVLAVTPEGGIVNDPVLLRLGEQRFWLSTSNSDLLLWARAAAINSGFDVAIGEPDVSPIQVQGPKSGLVIETLFGPAVRELRYYSLVETMLGDIPVVVTRTGWSGELGFEIFLCDSRGAEALWAAVLEAGRPHGLAVTGPSDIRRVEAGILGYGCDLSLETNPFEVGLDRLVDLDTPRDFVGKAALARIKAQGVRRRLVGIEISGPPIACPFESPWPVTADGARVGEVTVALHSPRLRRNLGYAMVAVVHGELGTRLNVAAPWGAAEAIVVPKPFDEEERRRRARG